MLPNVLRLGAVPHITNLIINHCTLSGIALNRCWAQYFIWSMTNKERNLIKKKILKCLTEDFKGNQAIFDKKGGWQVFNGTDLDMVMDAVIKGLEMAKHEINEVQS